MGVSITGRSTQPSTDGRVYTPKRKEMRQTLVMLGVLIVAVAVYWPILKIAREDMAARARAGLGNGMVYAVLLLPLVGPVVYLVFRKFFAVDK